MPTYVIERNIPGAGALDADALRSISQRSCSVLQKLGPAVRWVQSYVTGDKVYCVYAADNEEIIREHGRLGEFPVDRVSEVRNVIGPGTAE